MLVIALLRLLSHSAICLSGIQFLKATWVYLTVIVILNASWRRGVLGLMFVPALCTRPLPWSFLQSCEVDACARLIVGEETKHRKVEWLAQGFTASKLGSRGLNPGSMALEPSLNHREGLKIKITAMKAVFGSFVGK